jgi:enoyl-CoA hydratase/carnithine racemase
MNHEHIRVERTRHVATVTLARPEKRNALSLSMLATLEEIARGFAADELSRVVVFRADGADFSVGADLNEMGAGAEAPSLLMLRRRAEMGARLMRSLREIHQPTVCAIQGISTGGATCIASACDFRIGTTDCRMGYGEVKLGINLMWNALPDCVHLVGPSRAKQMVMSGRLFDAAVLANWGMLDELCASDELDARATAWAVEYASLPPIAVQMIKRSVNAISGALDASIMHMDADQWLLTAKSDDFREGVGAFMEKRSPQFTGN